MAKNPFSVTPAEMQRLRQTYKGKTTKPVNIDRYKVDAKPRAKPQPKLKVAPMPSIGSAAQSVLSALRNAPQGLADLAVALPTAAYDYVRTSTPSSVAGDIKRGVTSAVNAVRENPGETFADLVAGGAKGTGEMLREASLARDAGDEERAAQIESLAVPMLLGSLIPGGRAAKGAGKIAKAEERALLKKEASLAAKGEETAIAKPTGSKPAATAPSKPKTEKPFAAKTEGEKSLAVPSKQNEPRKAVISDVRDVGLGQQKYVTPEGAWLTVMENAKFAPRQHSVTDFVVPEELRGQGLGGALLDEVLAKYPLDSLSAAISSEPSVRAFYKRGFRPLGNPQGSLDDALAIMRDDSSVSMGVPRTPQGIIAYHGSPHSFDRFDISKIGTGEGAQAYGHGLYFAEAEDTARNYRNALARPEPGDMVGNAYDLVRILGEKDALENLKGINSKEAIATADAIISGAYKQYKPPGSMYQVRIKADPNQLLNWDQPIIAQSPEVQQAALLAAQNADISHLGSGHRARVKLERFMDAAEQAHDPLKGSELMMAVDRGPGNNFTPETSELLRAYGIPGVKYLDQASRTAGEGTRNYVVFDDALIDLLRRYAKGGIV